MERFLRYSLEHSRAIRMIWMEEGTLCQGKVYVEKLAEDCVQIYVLRPPRQLEIPIRDILSCDYTKDDEGID